MTLESRLEISGLPAERDEFVGHAETVVERAGFLDPSVVTGQYPGQGPVVPQAASEDHRLTTGGHPPVGVRREGQLDGQDGEESGAPCRLLLIQADQRLLGQRHDLGVDLPDRGHSR